MFAIVICLVLLMCTLTIRSSVVCVLMVDGMSVVVNVMLSLMSVMSPPLLVQPIGRHGGKFMYFGCVCFRGELGFLNCDDICMSVVNKFVYVYVFARAAWEERDEWMRELGLGFSNPVGIGGVWTCVWVAVVWVV